MDGKWDYPKTDSAEGPTELDQVRMNCKAPKIFGMRECLERRCFLKFLVACQSDDSAITDWWIFVELVTDLEAG